MSRVVVIDYETRFSDDYSLSKMTTESYIRDPRFGAHGAAIKWQHNIPARWYDESELRHVLKNEDWSDVWMICHHGQFDLAILAWHYDVHPRMLGCTLAMARLMLGNHIGVSLDSVRQQFGLPAKITPYNLFRGKTWDEMSPDTRQQVADGACDEVESIWKLFGILAKDFPKSQFEVIDIMLRMFVEPRLQGDLDLFGQIWEAESRRKNDLLQRLGVTESDLQSADRFAALLRERGVEPATKNGKNDEIYAFAKTDEFMKELLEDEDPEVRTLAEARLGVKSTILQTRAETLGWMARRGPLAVYLRPYGARTTRPSGGDKCLTADTQVIVYDWQKGLTQKRIVDILRDDLVWDGEEFVEHEGVAFQGYQEVIEHDSVRGTVSHPVFTTRGTLDLASAIENGASILDCPKPTSAQVDAVARNYKR